MNNGNGNGHVTVKLREKAEKILLSRYERTLRELQKRHDDLEKKHKKNVLKDLGLDKLTQRYKTLKEECEVIEEEVQKRAGRGYYSHSNIESGEVDGSKIQKEVNKRIKAELDLESEQKALQSLKDDLLEDLWLVDQTDEVKDILSKMK